MQALQVYDNGYKDIRIYVYIKTYQYIYIFVFCEYLSLKGVCVACLTGATCCCVLSKVIEI